MNIVNAVSFLVENTLSNISYQKPPKKHVNMRMKCCEEKIEEYYCLYI